MLLYKVFPFCFVAIFTYIKSQNYIKILKNRFHPRNQTMVWQHKIENDGENNIVATVLNNKLIVVLMAHCICEVMISTVPFPSILDVKKCVFFCPSSCQ